MSIVLTIPKQPPINHHTLLFPPKISLSPPIKIQVSILNFLSPMNHTQLMLPILIIILLLFPYILLKHILIFLTQITLSPMPNTLSLLKNLFLINPQMRQSRVLIPKWVLKVQSMDPTSNTNNQIKLPRVLIPLWVISPLCSTNPFKTCLTHKILHHMKRVPCFNTHTGPETMTHGPNYLQHGPLPYEAVPSFNAQMRPENIPLPSNSNNNVSVVLSGENQQKLKGVKHFSHHHALLFSEIKQQEDGILCSGCEQKVSGGSAYTCTVTNCNFNLHNSCFGLPREIKKHKSHPEHTLSLLSIPPYEDHHQFTCNACLENGGAFVYNCSTCNFDLHVECAFLPETVDREDHRHSLVLLYSSPFKKAKEDNPNMFFSCDVCHKTVDERCWLYYCQDCDFGTHLGCITSEQCPEEEEQQSQAVSELATMLETQAQLQRLQLEMQMSQQTAQLIASMGQSVLNLV